MTKQLANVVPMTTQELQSQLSSLGVEVKPRTKLKSNYSPQGAFLGSDVIEDGFKVDGLTTVGTARRTLDVLREMLSPAQGWEIEEWLAELDAITAKAKMDDISAAVKLSALTSRLADYPRDIVHDVLCVKTWRFFPTWADIEEIVSSRLNERNLLIRMIEDKLEAKANAKPRRETSAEELEEIKRQRDQGKADNLQLVSKLFPSVIQQATHNAGGEG